MSLYLRQPLSITVGYIFICDGEWHQFGKAGQKSMGKLIGIAQAPNPGRNSSNRSHEGAASREDVSLASGNSRALHDRP